jgi:hypothetical protein
MLTQFGPHLKLDEAGRPGDEAAVSAKLARLADHQQQRIGSCLARDVVQIRPTETMRRASLRHLESGCAKKYCVQITAGALVVGSAIG